MASAGVSPEVRDELLALLKTFPDSRYRPEIEHVLGICNIEMLFSRRQFPGDAIYPVGDGDTIYRIAKEHDIPQDLLLRVNGMSEADARRLGLGRRIKIPKVDFSIRVDKSDNTLTLMNFGRFFKRYLVRTGVEEWQTPAGQYKVQSKKRDPEWTDPQTGRRHAPNAAGNELGTRWIGFLDPSLGIHGTIHPDTVGGYASNGCVGMFRQDVEEIFDLVQLGTPVEIVGATRPAPIVRRE
jgi:hypothetical protein